ncbi:hypothetical protein MSG28_012182 [Choristoneura fumiferana]|uniref:Uncharacterized protein n=1 Tax=Choristoneura fumiferana TaxID=7141 RepID=A0ACC0KCU2_CHOFU|nr:hypothetical protein MSG28_012182 [Choristoneura fumiferana]
MKIKITWLVILVNSALTSSLFIPTQLPEDATLNYTQLGVKYGHKVEEHTVVTEDGYILTLFRMPGKRKTPVFLMHGSGDSSDAYMLRGNKSMAISLANEGYDVWAGNGRGNYYSRRHVKLDPDTDPSFWDYSFHERGYYDLPAIIDYILEATGEKSLQSIAHSQGTMNFFVLLSSKPEYNDKLKVFIAMAPIAYLHNLIPPVSIIVSIPQPEDATLNFTGLGQKYGHEVEEHSVVTEDGYILTVFRIPSKRKTPVMLMHGTSDSSDSYIIRGNRSLAIYLANEGYDVWAVNGRGNHYSRRHVKLDPDTDPEFWDFTFHERGIFPGQGYDAKRLEPSFLPVALGHVPAGDSKKGLLHHNQAVLSKRFAPYDYGPVKNKKLYGHTVPPEYNLSQATAKIALIVGKNDHLSRVRDVEKLKMHLPNVVKYHVMQENEWNHLDFVWGNDMPETLFPVIFPLFEKYS